MATKKKKVAIVLGILALVGLAYKYTPLGAYLGNLTGKGTRFTGVNGMVYEKVGESILRDGQLFNSEAVSISKGVDGVTFSTKSNHTWVEGKGWIS